MNKIVCDVCGTSYPDTSVQCPICGTAKTDANKTSAGSETGYAYVKGGRFSKANVRKRNAGQVDLPRVVAPAKPKQEKKPAPAKKQPSAPVEEKKQQPQEKQKSNVILMVIAALLMLAIVAVCIYIVREQIADRKPPVGGTISTTQGTLPSDKQVPCTGLTLGVKSHTFTTAGESFMLSVQKDPIDTTDVVRYESADEKIATVDNKGIVTAVADGTVEIYVYCGDQMVTCMITCDIGIVSTQPSEPSQPTIVLELNSAEFTLRGYGTTHMLYSGELDPSQIVWTSSDEKVATVTNGEVMAVGNGNAVITAEYMGQTATCIVHCQDVVKADYELRTRYGLGHDFTLKVGDTIVLYLADKASGLRIQAEHLNFSVSRDGVIKIDADGKITALSSGTVTVTVTYGELSFKAIVRVTK